MRETIRYSGSAGEAGFSAISGIRSDYENNVKTQINTMFGTLGDTSSAVQSLFTSMDNGVEDMENWRRMQDPVWRR